MFARRKTVQNQENRSKTATNAEYLHWEQPRP
jgi:hypothetical protein